MRPEKDAPLLLSVQEAARLLDVNPITVYRMSKRGELPALKVGARLKITRAGLQAWIEAQLQKHGTKTKKGGR